MLRASKGADRIVGLYQDRAREWDQMRPRKLMEKAWLDRFIDPTCGGHTIWLAKRMRD